MYRDFDLNVQKPAKADLPGSAHCRIEVVARSADKDQDEDEKEHIFVGADCASYRELEIEIRGLKKALDKVLRKGRRVYEASGK